MIFIPASVLGGVVSSHGLHLRHPKGDWDGFHKPRNNPRKRCTSSHDPIFLGGLPLLNNCLWLVSVQRLQHTYSRMHDEVSAFCDVYQAMHRYLPFPALLRGLGELLDSSAPL